MNTIPTFNINIQIGPRPGPDGPNASGWYRRLREPISPLSLVNSDQLWQLFSRGCTILLSAVIYDLDSRIIAKYSKCQTSFYSMQVSFRFHSLRSLRYLYLRVSAQRFEPGGFIEEVSNNFSVSWVLVETSPISRWPSRPIWVEIPTTILQSWFVPIPSRLLSFSWHAWGVSWLGVSSRPSFFYKKSICKGWAF